MPSTRRAVLGVALAGCAGETPTTGTDSSPSPGSAGTETTASPPVDDLPPVPEPSDPALDRWCGPTSGVAASRLTVLGEALGAIKGPY